MHQQVWILNIFLQQSLVGLHQELSYFWACMVINKKSQTWKTFNENKWHNAWIWSFTLFSQKSEHIVTTHSSMSGSNKLVENHPCILWVLCVPGKKKKILWWDHSFSPLIVCLQINLPNVKTCGMPSRLIKHLKVTWMMGLCDSPPTSAPWIGNRYDSVGYHSEVSPW